MEVVREVDTRLVEWGCPYCREGTLRRVVDAPVLMTCPAKILHRCTKCGREEYDYNSYPYLEYIVNSSERFSGAIVLPQE